MSRGPGWLQLAILKLLESEERRMDTYEITATVYAIERNSEGQRIINDAQHAAVRRALTSLAKQGKITRLRGYIPTTGANNCRCWSNNRFGEQLLKQRACLHPFRIMAGS